MRKEMIKMKMNSITDTITNAIFSPLKSWAEHSPGNWNILIGSGFVLLVVGLFLTFVFTKKWVRLTKEQTKSL